MARLKIQHLRVGHVSWNGDDHKKTDEWSRALKVGWENIDRATSQ